MGFVEAYAVQVPAGFQRVEDSHSAFTVIFLQEEYRHQDDRKTPRVAPEAIITTIFEILYLQTRARVKPKTATLLPHLVHMCLVPFIGAGEANVSSSTPSSPNHAKPRTQSRLAPGNKLGAAAGFNSHGTRGVGGGVPTFFCECWR